MKYVIGFTHRLAYALLTAIVVWILYVFPFDDRSHSLRFAVVKVLDWPVAMVSQQMPPSLKAIDVFSDYPFAHNARPDEMLLLHMRVAVPVYLILFYVPALVVWIVRKVRNGRSTDPVDSGIANT